MSEPSRQDHLRELVRRVFHEVISDGDLDVADLLIRDDFVDHWTVRIQAPQGLSGFKRGLDMVRASFPNWSSRVDDMVVEGDMVAARWTVRGTHCGEPFMGIPASGKNIQMQEAGMLRFHGDMLAEIWRVADELSLMTQLGVLTPPMAG